MAKLRRLKIEKFRNVVPGTELSFNDGFNVLLGQNGTGKTNLLKLIAMALSSDFSELEEEAFAIEYEIEAARGTLTVNVRNEGTSDGLRARVGHPLGMSSDEPGTAANWSYRARIAAPNGAVLTQIEASPLGACVTPGASTGPIAVPVFSPFQRVFLVHSVGPVLTHVGEPVRSILDDVTRATLTRTHDRFDEALEFFQFVTAEGLSALNAIAGVWLILLSRPSTAEAGRNVFASRVPRSVTSAIHAGHLTTDDERIMLKHDVLPFLSRTIELCGFSGGHMTLVREHLRHHREGVFEARYGGFTFAFSLDDGTVITHRGLSYGQKRLLSFLYYLELNDDIVIADELVNGLHYDWIEACIHEIGGRQAFLTSQNPILLDFLPFESAEQVRRSFLLCRLERREGGSAMVWRNLDADAAEDFFRSYQTKALQVSEILRTQGLW